MVTSGELAASGPASIPARRRRFVAFHKSDRNFFLVFLAICWLGVLMGFEPAVAKRIAGEHRKPGIDPAERDQILSELHAVREEVAELAERMDFAERLLAKPRDG